jgi:hypothetical protein
MRKLAFVLGLCAWIPWCWGQSGSQKKRRAAADSTSQTATDQRGTKQSPLIVDTQGHQDNPAEAADKQREKDTKDRTDSRTLLSTEITAGATVVLLFVGIGGVLLARRTLSAIDRQGEDTHRAILLTQRPKLIVRNIVIWPTESGAPLFGQGRPVSGQFYVANMEGAMPPSVRVISW